MTAPDGLGLWSTPQWRAQATHWLDERLAEHGLERLGEVEQPHLRAWATVLRAPTTGGVVWLKAPGGGTAFEVALYPLLTAAAPGQVLVPLAVDLERTWLLLPDGGTPLGEVATGPALVEALAVALPGYARLQRRLAAHTTELLALGLTDLRPPAVPARYAECLQHVAGYLASRSDPGEVETLDRLRALTPTVTHWARELAASAVPASLDHNDLHPWNLLCPNGEVTEARPYDWGDAVVGHPFASLMVTMRWLTEEVGLAPDGAPVRRVRDAYLAEFIDLAPPADLIRAFELADRVARIGRALSWIAVLHATGNAADDERADAPLFWLATLLDVDPTG